MFTLAATIAYLTITALVKVNLEVELNPIIQRILVALIFIPLGIFLLLQILLFVARPSAKGEDRRPEREPRS
jgi:hypothetical protein